jgi:hypothetical protein
MSVHACAGAAQVTGPPPHAPFWQATPAGQTLPQPPQFAGSCVRSAQKPLVPPWAVHIACGGAQVIEPGTHIAPMQIVAGGQRWPHVPQFPESRDRSVQKDPPAALWQAFGDGGMHIVVPPPPHIPIWHATPDGQARPHAPQFAASAVRSAQYEPPVADGHIPGADGGQPPDIVPPQTPPTQATPIGHIAPHRPQLPASVSKFVQLSPPATKHAFGVDPPHDTAAPPPQLPFTHAAPAGQAMPQFPQFIGSLIMSVQIGPCEPGQVFGWLGGQVMPLPPHIPFWQATPDGQTCPHAPQLAGSLLRFAQYGMPPADMQPFGAVAGQPALPPHAPFTHATPAGQVLPQPPQFAASDCGLAQ